MRCGKSSLGLGRYIASDGQRDADENARIVPVLSFPIPSVRQSPLLALNGRTERAPRCRLLTQSGHPSLPWLKRYGTPRKRAEPDKAGDELPPRLSMARGTASPRSIRLLLVFIST